MFWGRTGKSAIRTLLILLVLIAGVEGAIMLVLGQRHAISWAAHLQVILLDAGILAVVLAPFIYRLFIKPRQVLEERYRNLIEFAPDSIVSLDREGKIVFINAALGKITGYPRAEVVGRGFWEFVAPHDLPQAQALFEKARSGQPIQGAEILMRTRNGEDVPIELSSLPHFENKVFQGGVAILRDLQPRKRMEETLYRVQQDWKDAFDSITDMITVHDKDYNIIHANKSAEKILGLPFLESGGAKCFQYYHGTACPPLGCPSCQTYRTGIPATQELFEPHLQRFLEIRAIPRFDREHQLVGLIHVVRDITEKRHAEDLLRESEQQYRFLFQDSPQPMWVFDTETLAFLAVNEAAVRHYGYSREEFLAMTIKDIRPPEDVPALLKKMEERTTALNRAGIWRHRRKDGSLIFVDIASHPTTFAGRAAKLILVNDVTEQKKLEAQLRHAQKMEAVGQLAGGVAHDFNNILSVVVTYASLLQMKMPAESPLQSYVDPILKSAERAGNLTRSLLTFSRKQVYELRPVDLNDVIRNIAKLLQRVLGEETRMHTTLSDHPLFILADSGQVEQVIMNLCTNAKDAMPQGGSLTIDTESEEIGDDFIQAYGFGRVGSYAVLAVSDTGQGMDEATRLRIFEPFFTTKEVGRGTGLGLAIVYGIIKQHEGFINVRSRPGEGTVFRIYLPLIHEAVAAGAQVQPPPPVGGTECILLAEDEEEVRRIVSAVLLEYGYQVIVAVDGEDAVRQFLEAKERVQLFLTDVIMPKKNGKAAYEEMRAVNPDLKVIYSSGYTADLVEQKGIASGEINYLPKPVSPFALLRKVREVLDGR